MIARYHRLTIDHDADLQESAEAAKPSGVGRTAQESFVIAPHQVVDALVAVDYVKWDCVHGNAQIEQLAKMRQAGCVSGPIQNVLIQGSDEAGVGSAAAGLEIFR